MKQLTIVFAIITQVLMGQTDFKPVEPKHLAIWITQAKEKSEVNANAVPNLDDNYELAHTHPKVLKSTSISPLTSVE